MSGVLDSQEMDRLANKEPKAIGPIVEFIYGPLSDNPARVGALLTRELEGMYRATRGTYWILYTFDEAEIHIEYVGHRNEVYRTR